MHFGYTIVYVPDVQAAVSFYERAFGFKMRFNADDWDYAELETGDTTLAFAAEKMADMLGTSITPNRGNATAAGIELAFVTDEVQGAFNRATNAGAISITSLIRPHGARPSPTSATRTAS